MNNGLYNIAEFPEIPNQKRKIFQKKRFFLFFFRFSGRFRRTSAPVPA